VPWLPGWHKTRDVSPQICDTLTPGNARVVCHHFPGSFVSPLRVVLYARVSTHDQQTLAMQIDAMRKFVTRRGWTVTDAIEALALVPQRTAPSARSCSKRLGNASSRSLWCGSSTVGVR
jgi:hypothetical protein